MEALTAASVAALTVYDMVKGVERGVEISGVRLVSKTGGKSGEWHRGAAGDATEPPSGAPDDRIAGRVGGGRGGAHRTVSAAPLTRAGPGPAARGHGVGHHRERRAARRAGATTRPGRRVAERLRGLGFERRADGRRRTIRAGSRRSSIDGDRAPPPGRDDRRHGSDAA